MYSLEGWNAYIAPIKAQRRELVEQVMRLLHSTAVQVTPDSQGRVLLPVGLVQFAEIEKNVVVVGCCDYAEIWAEANYDRVISNIDDEALRRALEELGL
jgi:MraZ protein